MEKVVYTQRVEIVESYQERRDCADQNIPRFIQSCGYLPIPIPNVIEDVSNFIEQIHPSGIVLTGGNSLVKYGGQAPERDGTDRALIEIALQKGIPIYGFCRGMQSVLDYFGCHLENVENHTAVRHKVEGIWGAYEVNSFHNQACKKLKEPLRAAAQTADGVIEAAICEEKKIIVTMWHPEREKPFNIADKERLKRLFDLERR